LIIIIIIINVSGRVPGPLPPTTIVAAWGQVECRPLRHLGLTFVRTQSLLISEACGLGGGKWVRPIQSRSCCPRQPCALVSVRAHRASRSVYVRGGEQSSYITKVLRMHTATCTLVCFQRTMHVDACKRWALGMPLFAHHFAVLALRTKGPSNWNTLGKQWNVPADSTDSSAGIVWLSDTTGDAFKHDSLTLAVNRHINENY
jgi:hypothetical protein